MDNTIELKDFNLACDDFIKGKYILAEMKISTILETLSKNNKLKDIISKCLENYNFTTAFETCVGENHIITLPDDAKGIIAFVFSLLYNIDTNNINFYDFLGFYYNYNELNNMESFKIFATNIILPFKEAINNVFAKTHVLVDTQDYQSNIYNKLKKVCSINMQLVDDFKLTDIQREEFLTLLEGMKVACTKNDKEVVYALLIGFEYFSYKIKRTKVVFEQFKECFEA